jgi:hypothetical protein
MGYSREHHPTRTFGPCAIRGARRKEIVRMQKLKSQGFRILLVLSALASSALVLEAGQRWR